MSIKQKIKAILCIAVVEPIADRLADEIEKLFIVELTETAVAALKRVHEEIESVNREEQPIETQPTPTPGMVKSRVVH